MNRFWRTVVKFDRDKFEPWLALRCAIGVAAPLIAGAITGRVADALAVAMGAFNVSFSDSHEPYPRRARRMLATSVLVAIAVSIGESIGGHFASFAVTGLWACAAGMMVALSAAAADVGAISLVVLLVYAAYPQSPDGAVVSGILALAGGLMQTALSLSLWPVRRHGPERRALAALYLELARAAQPPLSTISAPFASAESTEAQHKLAASSRSRSEESQRYRTLLSEAERIRLGLLGLHRSEARLQREAPEREESRIVSRYLEITSGILEAIGKRLSEGRAIEPDSEHPGALVALARRLPSEPSGTAASTLASDARFQMDAVAGQLRAALDLADDVTPEGAMAAVRREAHLPWRLRVAGTVATLRANLTLQSAAARHAVRLGACVAIGEALGRALQFQRSYWVPMTVAIVLKPDFTATFSRGLLRLVGTFAGLAFATGMVHLLPSSVGVQVAEIAVLVYVMRYIGPANYGVLVILVTGIVVVLMSLAGVGPAEVMAARGLNTAVGGAIALGAYAMWPTWERRQIRETVARMLDAYREYFQLIQRSYARGRALTADLDRRRLEARLARSNVEAALERMQAEPGTTGELRATLSGFLADSHRMVHAMMALEAGLSASRPAPARAAFVPFAQAVEVTLHSLAAALRGSPLEVEELPDLRRKHDELAGSGDPLTERYALVNLETDRITNSLNTLSLEIVKWVG
jgi:uncharacterized membrane protein YccC